MRNSSTSGGAGTMAENVVAGSVPMATATSMRPCRLGERRDGGGDGGREGDGAAGGLGHDARRIAVQRLFGRSRACGGIGAGVRGSVRRRLSGAASACRWSGRRRPACDTCRRCASPGTAGSRVMTQGRVMKRPPSWGQHEDGKIEHAESSRRMTCLQGASLAATSLGKKLPISASMGSMLELVEEAFGER